MLKYWGLFPQVYFLFTIINACFLHFSSKIIIGVSAGLTFLKTIVFLICMCEKIKYYLKKLLNCFFFCFNRFGFVTSCFHCCLRNCKSTFHDSNKTIFSPEDRNKDESNSSQTNLNSNDSNNTNNTNNLNVENLGPQLVEAH